MTMVERKINIIIAKNPKLINSFDRTKNHPLNILIYHSTTYKWIQQILLMIMVIYHYVIV